MRSSLVVLGCSLTALGGLTMLGLNVPVEEMVQASNTAASPSDGDVDAFELVGPYRTEAVGPFAPSVPALAVHSAALVESTAVATAPTPSRLRVPALDIDASIIGVGVDAQGLLDVPNPHQVGWYQHGSTPGTDGAAVLAAHVDLGHIPGVFYDLDAVLVGDRIYVDFDDGTSRAFDVVDEVLYDKSALPEDDLFRRSGDPLLQLVTCGGSYDPVTRHYLGNRVVTARPVD